MVVTLRIFIEMESIKYDSIKIIGMSYWAFISINGIISYPFFKDGPVFPVLKEIGKKPLKHLS